MRIHLSYKLIVCQKISRFWVTNSTWCNRVQFNGNFLWFCL